MTLEPLAAMPSPRDQLEQILRLARTTTNVSDRFALLQSALTLLAAPGVTGSEATRLRRQVVEQIDREVAIDQRYSRVTRDLLARATKAAENAQIRDVERVLERIPKEDTRLGSQRPEIVQALTASVQSQLANARQLRLLRDQWKSRQAGCREYQRSVGMDLVQLVKARTSLESIKKLMWQ